VTRRAGVVAGAAAVVICGAAAVTAGWVNRAVHNLVHNPGPAVSTPVSASPGSNDVAAAVVNINGFIPEGRIAGTGMIIAADGLALTNNHVVAGTVGLTAQVAGTGPVYHATVLGVDPTQDVAVIRLVGASGLPTVPLETSGVVTEGDQVTGMGNALGVNGAPVSASGVVTALNETLTVTGDGDRVHNTLNGLIRFSAPIQPGDSGGPLLNAAGRVIGMDTAGSPTTSVPPGGSVGAAIPITTALAVARDIIAGVTSAYIQSGHSGILGIAVTDATGVDGAKVTSVTAGDAAAGAGLVGGDVITRLGTVSVHSAADFDAAATGRRPGDRVSVGWRDSAGGIHQAIVALSPGPPA
jgi:S1-C subfamily serine protease